MNGGEVDEVLIATQAAAEVDGEGLSQVGLPPKQPISHNSAVTMMRATGAGFCVVTNAMYAAMLLLMWRDQNYPRGNTNYGRSYVDPSEYGLRPDGDPAIGGNVNGNNVVLTGTSPIGWNWPRSPFGVQGLNGNVMEWLPGVRLNDGEINIIENNNAALGTADFSDGSSEWKAIDRTDGSLVAPGSNDTVKYATSGTTDGTLVISGGRLENITPYGVSDPTLEFLRTLALITPSGAVGYPTAQFTSTLSGYVGFLRGASWPYGVNGTATILRNFNIERIAFNRFHVLRL